MQGEAGGDGERVRHNTRKRDLYDAPEVGLGVADRSAKRRHTTDSPGHPVDESTSNSSSSHSRGPKVKNSSASGSPKSPLDTLQLSLHSSGSPTRQKHDSLKPPTSSNLAAKALGASGGPQDPWGARPSFPGGLSSGHAYQKTKQNNPLPNGPPTSSSTSSDASSIPAGSTRTLPFVASKGIPQKSSHSLRYGSMPAVGAAAGDGSPQNNDKPGREAKGRKHTATGMQRRQSDGQGNALPTPRLDGTRETPHAIASSDDGSYVDEDENNSNDDHDEDVVAFPTTRQRSTRLRARHSDENISKGKGEDGNNGEHEAEQGSYTKTPSGKDYHQFLDENSNMRFANVTLFPDGYRLQPVPGTRVFQFPCPVRTCTRDFKKLEHLEQHFQAISPSLLFEPCFSLTPTQFGHPQSDFNDNLDEDGTLEYIRRRKGSSQESVVVSQNPRHPAVLSNGSSTLQPERHHDPVEPAANKASKKSPGVRLHNSFSGHAKDEPASITQSELDRTMAESKVWAYVAPLVPSSWGVSINDDLEARAFIQAISLPLRNEVDKAWLAGTKNSHQRLYRALMSVIFQAVGVESHCKPCESKIPERRRNCKVLPPEAADMRELQKVCGSQCVNCYFFRASIPCEFPESSTKTKKTPVPLPVLPVLRTILNIEGSVDLPSTTRVPAPAANRPPIPSYSSYKATKAEKPVSESPVPIPLFANRGPTRQSEAQDTLAVSSEKTVTKSLRRSGRMPKTNGEPSNSRGIIDDHDTDKSKSSPAASAALDALDASSNGPTRSALVFGGSNAKTSPPAASNLSCGETSSPQLASRMFSLFGDIGRLPAEEQAALWDQMQQMSTTLQTGSFGVSSTSGILSDSQSLVRGPPAAADGWEIAPGRLIVNDKQLAFSTSFLSRDFVSLEASQQLSPTQRVMNKSIPALKQLSLGPEEGWNCMCSVIRGVLKMKVGDVEARIGQGGVISVEKECIITNVSHKEARIQVWWVEEG